MSEYCYGTLAILGGLFLILAFLVAIAPEGEEDERGYHEAKHD